MGHLVVLVMAVVVLALAYALFFPIARRAGAQPRSMTGERSAGADFGRGLFQGLGVVTGLVGTLLLLGTVLELLGFY